MIAALAVLVAALGGVLAWVVTRIEAEQDDRCASSVRADEGIARLDAALEATAKAVADLRAGAQRWDGLWKSLAGSCDQLCERVEAQTRMLRIHEAELARIRNQHVGDADALATLAQRVMALEHPEAARPARKAVRK